MFCSFQAMRAKFLGLRRMEPVVSVLECSYIDCQMFPLNAIISSYG